jgi:hypothetical protein
MVFQNLDSLVSHHLKFIIIKKMYLIQMCDSTIIV